MDIAATTRISSLIKENPDAVEAIASISRHFEKLRNPLLRKLLASRVTIGDAARIGGCEVEAFYEKLAPLGFTVSATQCKKPASERQAAPAMPAFLRQLPLENIHTLDVREAISTGSDPFQTIMGAVDELGGTSALLLVNTFEPTPLMSILAKKGYAAYAEEQGPDLVYTYFWLEGEKKAAAEQKTTSENGFDALLARYNTRVEQLDVRHLEMPQPMVAILRELEQLPPGGALHVTHRRVPQFLLPQLAERGFTHAIREIGPAEVHLLIYKIN